MFSGFNRKPSILNHFSYFLLGTVAVQLAKALGAHVVGVCSSANVQMVKAIGADEVVDYKTTDVTQVYRNQDFDLIFDTVGPATEVKSLERNNIDVQQYSAHPPNRSTCFTFLSLCRFGPIDRRS